MELETTPDWDCTSQSCDEVV